MARRYRRRHRYTVARPLKTTKYSNETYCSFFNLVGSGGKGTHGIFSVPIIPNAIGGILGTRKAKNFTLRICPEKTLLDPNTGDESDVVSFERARVAFALVFVPEGTSASPLHFGAGQSAASLYEPNQNVILTGLVSSDQTYSFKTRLARNLNAGDSILLCFYDLYATSTQTEMSNTPIAFTCNYAISF